MRKIKAYDRVMRTVLLALAGAALASCDSLIFDDRDDCRTDLRLKFRYDWNMKFADAFAHEVKTVHVRAYDESGQLVLDKTDSGAALAADGYTMSVDELQPGVKYDFHVWAEGEDRGDSYDFGPSTAEQQLTARLSRTDATVSSDLTPLFHGRLTGQSFERKYDTAQTIEIPLTKDTKNIKVVLQELNGGQKVDPADFTLTITDDNGYLNYDNSLLADERLTYLPWSVSTGEAGVDEGDTKVEALVAEFSVNRLVKDGHAPRLTVADKSGATVLSIPLIDYFLLVKGNYNSSMSDQEYLDRQDTYDLVFFISRGAWIRTYIYINSWRIVPPQSSEL